MTNHVPVLLKQVIEHLDPKPNQHFIDCTFGGGGHSLEILKYTAPNGKILAIDQDPNVAKQLGNSKLSGRIKIVNSNFNNLEGIYKKEFPVKVSGVLFDLGFSSDQLQGSGRGFSFQIDEPLDMRLAGDKVLLTAREIVNQWSEEEIAKILRTYGEEPDADKISDAIVKHRKDKLIETTFNLKEIILSVKSPHARRALSGIHPVTKTFQALRIAVNDELAVLSKALPQAVEVLDKGGRLAVIAFHGLEDRVVKRFFRSQDHATIAVVTKKPITPTKEEIIKNPRSRSAKMRIAEKI